jgi:hypothetical protein
MRSGMAKRTCLRNQSLVATSCLALTLMGGAAFARVHSHRAHFQSTEKSEHVGAQKGNSKGRAERGSAVKDASQRSRPCPSRGRSSGPCLGYVTDHVVRLKRGGADDPGNMQWQTMEAAKEKDRWE